MTHAEALHVQPNPHVSALPAYNAGTSISVARAVSGRDDIAALASNENPYGVSPRVVSALAAMNPARYSDSAAVGLRDALSAKLSVASNRIVCGNGSEELIAAIARAFLVEGDDALTVAPCFGLHEIEPLAAGARVIKVPMTAAKGFDVGGLIHALEKAPKVIFLSSPWNPVGSTLTASELARICDAVPRDSLLVLDEAYFEMIDAHHPDGLEMLSQCAAMDWVVLRTFSKAYGLAGLRVGYGIASSPEIARLIRSASTPFNVNAAAQAAAVAALSDETWMREAVARLCADREIMRADLVRLGLSVAPSQANFLFVDIGTDAGKAAEHLLTQGIIVKAWKEPGYRQFLRVTVGLPEDNKRFVHALGDYLRHSIPR